MAWLNSRELADELEVSPSTVRRWNEEGCPRGISPDGKTVYLVEAVAAWLTENEEEPDDSEDDDFEDGEDDEEDENDDE